MLCGDFIAGPSAWPYVLVATTIADGAASQGSQTFNMNVTNLPAVEANFRVFKTTANGSSFFGNPVALTLGSNSITVAAVSFDRAVKFQFSSGDVEFDALTLNGVASSCVGTIPSVPGCTDVNALTMIQMEQLMMGHVHIHLQLQQQFVMGWFSSYDRSMVELGS